MSRERQSHTDAGGDAGDSGDDDRRMRDTHRHPLGECLGRAAVGHVAAHEHEPLGVHVRDDVARACHRAQARRDRFEQLCTGLVTETIAHVREVVELD
jgi:hypothetical protein